MINQASLTKALCVMLLLLSAGNAFAAKKYRIYGDVITGSRVKPVEVESLIPFDKSYSQLTKKQKNLFRASYAVLKDSETPPYPKEGTEKIYVPMIKANKMVGKPGKLFLVANVDEAGKVQNVSVYESPSPKITKIATNLLLVTEFDPATCDGKPCTMEFPFEFDMRALKKEERTDVYRKIE